MLTAVPRPPETDRGNLFVRLTPRTAWRLAEMLICRPQSNGNHVAAVDEYSSGIYDVDFLPLEITFRGCQKSLGKVNDERGEGSDGDVTVYASYNGGAPACFVGPNVRCGSMLSQHYQGK